MSEYIIFTDANSDLTAEIVEKINVNVIPMRFSVDGTEYYNYPDHREMTSEEFFARLRNGSKAATTQTNTAEFEDFFTPYLKEGKDVLYICFSSALSGTYHSSTVAAENLKVKFPDRTITMVDTLSISWGQAALVTIAAEMKQQGKSIAEVATWAKENGGKVAHLFTVDDLNFLKRGGRLSGGAALMGTMLSIKPILALDEKGKIVPVDKIRGRKNSLARIIDEVEKSAVDVASRDVYVAHGDCREEAEFVAKEIRSRISPRNVFVEVLGPVIGGHAGPNTVAVFFFTDGRKI